MTPQLTWDECLELIVLVKRELEEGPSPVLESALDKLRQMKEAAQ